MEEMESAPGKTEPRWKMAGPPYLLTRDELLQELRSSGYALSDRRLRDWATEHIIPRPRRRVPAQAPDRVPRVLYPSFMVAVIKDLLDAESTSQTTREELRQMAPQRIQYWQARYGDNPEVKEIPPSTSTFSGGATIPIPISAGTLVSAPSGPAPAQRLRLAVWGHAARVAERNAIRVTEATLMLKTEDGTVITIPIHPVPAPRKTMN